MISVTRNVMVATLGGKRAIHEFRAGDRVVTRDNGPVPISAVRHKVLTGRELKTRPHLRPIMIRAGSLGDGLPAKDLMVSPNQRVQVAAERGAVLLTEDTDIVAAKHLIDNDGVYEVAMTAASYVHLMFDEHQTILANDLWCESFQISDWSLGGRGNAQRLEIREIFPELKCAARPAETLPEPDEKPRKRFLFF